MDEFISFANKLTDVSAEIARNYFHHDFEIEVKADSSPVTIADKKIEEALRSAISEAYPNHSIEGEEFGATAKNSEYKWVIDPIDGTSSFMIGRPIFGTLIALLKDNKPIIGVIDQPITGERWLGVDGEKTLYTSKFLSNRKAREICTRKCSEINNAILCTTSPDLFDGYEDKFALLRDSVKHTVYGGDCYSYGLVAKGKVDIVFESGLNPYDIAAIIPVIKGAGGNITDWKGKKIDLSLGKINVLATCNLTLHEKIVKLIG